jgi:hypothetical protein
MAWYMGKHLAMQICNTCNLEKPLSFFAIHSNGKPRKQCRVCKKNGDIHAPHRIKKSKEWAAENKDRLLGFTREWRKRNLEYDAYRAATYRAEKAKRTPPWVNKEMIKLFYLNCPKGYHVDHIIPLRGKIVSGLHTLENLQYLPAKENLAKRNYYDI